METYKDNYLMHYGIPGMKWGHRKQRVLSGRQLRKQRKQALKESKKNKPTVRNMVKSQVNSSDYNLKGRLKSPSMKAGAALAVGALAVMGGTVLSSGLKSGQINVGKSIANGLMKANYKVGYTAGRTVATARAIKASPSGYAKAVGNTAARAIKSKITR